MSADLAGRTAIVTGGGTGVGRGISLSRERVRQLERDALRLLRESGRIREEAA